VTLPSQLRAARSLLGLSQADIAARAGVSVPTLKRAEADAPAIRVSVEAAAAIRRALEAAGVEFANGGQPGVRLRGPGGTIPADQLNASNDE
jgi:transcriptional regulator with XRE-family HTH domain